LKETYSMFDDHPGTIVLCVTTVYAKRKGFG
jgi:hypothetical protein